MGADIPLFLEHGVVKGVLSYPEYYEIMSIVKLAQKRELTPKYCFNEEALTTSVKEKPYDYCHDTLTKKNKTLFDKQDELGNFMTKSEAIQSLRVLMSVAKNDGARHQSSIYEPFLTKMVTNNVLGAEVTVRKSRLIS